MNRTRKTYTRNVGMQRKRRLRNMGATAGLIVAGLVIALVAVFVVGSYYSEDTHTNCVVSEKDRTTKTDSNGQSSSDARVYTENCGVFQVADSLVKGQFSSADTFGSIEEGKTYDFTTIGWRAGFFSMFPNIIEVQES